MSGGAREAPQRRKAPQRREAPHGREGFVLLRPVAMRWSDIDRYGHANNVAVLSWFDTAVNDWYIGEGHLEPEGPRFVVARTGCLFHREIVYSDTVAIGIRASRIGTSSVTYQLAVFAEGEADARAQGDYVHVRVSARTGRPEPIGPAMRALLEWTRGALPAGTGEGAGGRGERS